jgi:large subunit ribosomal protein L4
MSQSRTVDVVDSSGTKAGSAELPAELFDVTANIPLIHQVVVAQLAAARQGTHATKTRSDVRGGGSKPYRQKGTGRARQGSIRAPQYVGGGIVHGPQPHGYAQRTPKKMIAAALRGALSDRARDGRVHVVSDLVAGDVPSTKAALGALARVTTATRVLVVLHRDEDLAWLSLRNAASVHAIAVDQLNAYDVLVSDDVVFTSAALAAYVAGPAKGKSGKGAATSAELDTPSPELETASAELETPSAELDTPSPELETPSAELETPSAELDTPSAELETPSAEPVEAPEGALRQAQGTESAAQGTENEEELR